MNEVYIILVFLNRHDMKLGSKNLKNLEFETNKVQLR